jgi:DNA-binding NarL/FixJ family response regulator
MTVFLIDDNSMYLQVTKQRLKPYVDQVFVFSSYRDALNNAELKPDIIFLDYLFDSNEINGATIVNKIMKLNPQQKIVIVSGQESGDVVHNLVKLGIRDYIVKEGNYIEEMISVIKDYKNRIEQNEKV